VFSITSETRRQPTQEVPLQAVTQLQHTSCFIYPVQQTFHLFNKISKKYKRN